MAMRIVAGRWRGRQIEVPVDPGVRPTADKIREAWLSIVSLDLPDARVLELFAGSGALGLEALSRGAASADFVESSPRALVTLRRNIEGLGAAAASTVHRADAVQFMRTLPADAYDVVFADPPYALDAAQRIAERWLEVPFAGLLSIEHASATPMPPGGETRRYGMTSITFYRRPPAATGR
jgi:16S rRNA (guanine966-N2)-methyltransferase